MARAALTPEAEERHLQFMAESWRAEKERVSDLGERTKKLRALRLALVVQVTETKHAKPLKQHIRRAWTVIR